MLREHVAFGTGAHVRCLGKGRKKRCTPLRPDVAAVLQAWMAEQPGDTGRLQYKGVSFLQFLLSRETDIDAFRESRKKRRSLPDIIEFYPEDMPIPPSGRKRLGPNGSSNDPASKGPAMSR